MTSINLLFFASDFKIGLSTVLTDQLIAINKLNKIKTKALAGEKEQEEGLQDKISENKIDLENKYKIIIEQNRELNSELNYYKYHLIQQMILIFYLEKKNMVKYYLYYYYYY